MYDVAVIGGGISGCMAAIAAARCGASVILIEKYGFLDVYKRQVLLQICSTRRKIITRTHGMIVP